MVSHSETSIIKSLGRFCIGYDPKETDVSTYLEDIRGAVSAKREVRISTLGGRNCVSVCNLDGVGRVVVKKYMRGGLFQYLVKEKYIRSGKTRAEVEFDLLRLAKSVGVNVPGPVAFVYKGGFLYEAWLITREIQGKKSVAELSIEREDDLSSVMEELIRQVGILIRNGIFHVDLHPGNVLVDTSGAVYLLDFDKAYGFVGRNNLLRDKYLCRWRRAVIKHNLPEVLSEMMSHGLRQSYE